MKLLKREKKYGILQCAILLLPRSDSVATYAHIFEWKTFPVTQGSELIYYESIKSH